VARFAGYCILVTAGGFQVPSMIDGGVSLGQYRRSMSLNVPVGGVG